MILKAIDFLMKAQMFSRVEFNRRVAMYLRQEGSGPAITAAETLDALLDLLEGAKPPPAPPQPRPPQDGPCRRCGTPAGVQATDYGALCPTCRQAVEQCFQVPRRKEVPKVHLPQLLSLAMRYRGVRDAPLPTNSDVYVLIGGAFLNAVIWEDLAVSLRRNGAENVTDAYATDLLSSLSALLVLAGIRFDGNLLLLDGIEVPTFSPQRDLSEAFLGLRQQLARLTRQWITNAELDATVLLLAVREVADVASILAIDLAATLHGQLEPH